MKQTPQFDIVLCPDLKKSWVHYDVEIHNADGKKNWRDRIAIYRSVHYAGYINYASFRPDVESDLAETLNNYRPCVASLTNHEFYFNKSVPNNWRENVNSITIRNPVYYCLKSKLVWQNIEDDENPVFSDKLLEVKEYKKGSHVCVAQCQEKTQKNYDEGGSIEMERKSVNKALKMWIDRCDEQVTERMLKDHFYYTMLGLLTDEIDLYTYKNKYSNC